MPLFWRILEQCIPKKERLMLAPSHDLSICSVTRDHFLVSSFLLEPGPCQNLYPLVFVPSFVCSTIPVHKVLILLHTYVVLCSSSCEWPNHFLSYFQGQNRRAAIIFRINYKSIWRKSSLVVSISSFLVDSILLSI